jgi:hypothetical protein
VILLSSADYDWPLAGSQTTSSSFLLLLLPPPSSSHHRRIDTTHQLSTRLRNTPHASGAHHLITLVIPEWVVVAFASCDWSWPLPAPAAQPGLPNSPPPSSHHRIDSQLPALPNNLLVPHPASCRHSPHTTSPFCPILSYEF